MSETKFTPGPWKWGADYRGLYSANVPVLDYIEFEGMWVAYSSNHDANAALISAAPDLYAALEALVAWSELEDVGRRLTDLQSTARAALAKARGGE